MMSDAGRRSSITDDERSRWQYETGDIVKEWSPQEASTASTTPPSVHSRSAAVWGFYFPSPVLTGEQDEQVRAALERLFGPRQDLHGAAWSQADPSYRKAMLALDVRRPPAVVLVKPWFGGQLFTEQDWPHLLALGDSGQTPMHVVIQGSEAFENLPVLLDALGQLDILFGRTDDEIQSALRKKHFKELGAKIADWTGNVLKSIQLTIAAGGVTATIAYNERGGVDRAEEAAKR